MPYDKPPEKIKDLPAHAQDVWMSAFNNAWKEYNGDEEKCNAVAWSAVEKAGYKQIDGKWMKEEKIEETKLKESIIDVSDKYFNCELLERGSLSGAKEISPHKFRVELMNLEIPKVATRGWSDTGKYYKDKALDDIARLMNNKRSLASGHHDDARMRETVALISNCQKVADKKIIEADYEIIGEAQTWFEPLVKKQIEIPEANLVSLSINALGKNRWGKDQNSGKRGQIVESAHQARSTDAVFDAAAGGNFKSIKEEIRRSKMENITAKELKKENPDLYKEIQEEAQSDSEKKLKVEKEVREKAEKEVKDLKEEKLKNESKTTAEKLLKESKLNEIQAKGLLEVMTGKTEDEMKRLIEERKAFLRENAKELKVENLSFDRDESKDKDVKLTETQRQVWKSQGFTEKQMLKLAKGESLQEANK